MFKSVSPHINFPELEQKVLEYWKKNRIFEKSIKNRPEDRTWTFLDGPPFITGLPHYGSLLSSIPKDLFPRYFTMKGFRVRRVWGWDCHGLPAENKVEATLGVKNKRDIEEKVGIKKFIDECKRYVSSTSSEWEWYVDHVGRWVDFANAYKTMDTPYMESVMWVFKQMYDKGLIYKGLRVSLYCPHCGTPISNFEVAMDSDNYKEITEQAAVYKYELKGQKNTYLLAWSTTPWNKIATPALAVNPELTYVLVQQKDGKRYILAKSTLSVLNGTYKIVKTMKGSELVGTSFVPHYNFYRIDTGKNAFIVVPGDFVSADEGTGIVTVAAYGEEDLAVMQKENIQIVLHVDEEGKMKNDVPNWAGMYYLDTDALVIEDLQKRGLVYRADAYTHTVPTCWRCHTRLIYAPQDAWYVNVQTLKALMKKTNQNVSWYPSHFKDGRFAKSMEQAPDWCISRSRYWGSPVPVWECAAGHRFVPGSIAELEKASGVYIKDLHKPDIDNVVVPCRECGKEARRVPEVLDSWIEAGSASFAERHWPFAYSRDSEKAKNELAKFFPPDFIVEYTGQIRAWFYVLHVIAAALYTSHAFKNVVVTGVILGTDGRKMSKNYGNYPDPKELLTTYGADALRLYLMRSPVMHAEDILISEEHYRNQVRGTLLILWNVYSFFVTYASLDGFTRPESEEAPAGLTHVLDRWIISRLHTTLQKIETEGYEKFDTPMIVELVGAFLKDLSGWYVRRIRDRVGPSAQIGEDKDNCHRTLWYVLVTYAKMLAPVIPFVTEHMYQNLTGGESVHLTDWPPVGLRDEKLEESMRYAMDIASVIHAKRKEANLKVRIPLRSVSYTGPVKLDFDIEAVIAEETNVYEFVYKGKQDRFNVAEVDTRESNQDIQAGMAREFSRQIQILRKTAGCGLDEHVSITAPNEYAKLPSNLLEWVKRHALVRDISWDSTLTIRQRKGDRT